MNIHDASNLDIEKFRKVYALVTGGATDGERAAAKARASKIAERAGMTLSDAVSKLDAPKPTNFFEGWDDWMEEKEPGYKAKKAQENATCQDRYASRRAEILQQFGTVKAALDPNAQEQLLMQAAMPFITKWHTFVDVCGTKRKVSSKFANISDNFFKLSDVDPEAIAAIKLAFSFPETICGAFDELKAWDALNRDRAHFYSHHEYYFDLPIELRVELLREVLRSQPVASWDDLETRFHYKSYAWQQQWIDERDFEDEEWARLFADIRILRSAVEPSAPEAIQTGRRTNADKRAAILSMLDKQPELSDREISRRVGVSPQTVGNWRWRLNSQL